MTLSKTRPSFIHTSDSRNLDLGHNVELYQSDRVLVTRKMRMSSRPLEYRQRARRMRIGPVSKEDEIGYPEVPVLYLVRMMVRHGIEKDILDEQAMMPRVHSVRLPD